MRTRRRGILVVGAVLAGAAFALPSMIATEDMVIEVRSTPHSNVISVTDVRRYGDEITPLGPTRVYTERR